MSQAVKGVAKKPKGERKLDEDALEQELCFKRTKVCVGANLEAKQAPTTPRKGGVLIRAQGTGVLGDREEGYRGRGGRHYREVPYGIESMNKGQVQVGSLTE